MSRILVTGARGFIGGHLVDALIDKGHVIIAIDPSNIGHYVENKQIVYLCGNTQEWLDNTMHISIADIDYVVHLGAWSNVRESMNLPYNLYYQNVMACAAISQWLINEDKKGNKIKGLIFASSSACEMPLESHYGISKYTSEQMFRQMHEQLDIPVACLRFGNVYGERQNPANGTLVAKWIENIINDKPCQIYGSGLQKRDYIHVMDVVDAIQCCMDNSLDGVLNTSTGISVDTLHIKDKVTELVNLYQKYPRFEFADAPKGDKQAVLMPIAKEYNGLWNPKIKLDEGIFRQWLWRIERDVKFSWDKEY
jgi:UDP-glucose 4-epimerase